MPGDKETLALALHLYRRAREESAADAAVIPGATIERWCELLREHGLPAEDVDLRRYLSGAISGSEPA